MKLSFLHAVIAVWLALFVYVGTTVASADEQLDRVYSSDTLSADAPNDAAEEPAQEAMLASSGTAVRVQQPSAPAATSHVPPGVAAAPPHRPPD